MMIIREQSNWPTNLGSIMANAFQQAVNHNNRQQQLEQQNQYANERMQAQNEQALRMLGLRQDYMDKRQEAGWERQDDNYLRNAQAAKDRNALGLIQSGFRQAPSPMGPGAMMGIPQSADQLQSGMQPVNIPGMGMWNAPSEKVWSDVQYDQYGRPMQTNTKTGRVNIGSAPPRPTGSGTGTINMFKVDPKTNTVIKRKVRSEKQAEQLLSKGWEWGELDKAPGSYGKGGASTGTDLKNQKYVNGRKEDLMAILNPLDQAGNPVYPNGRELTRADRIEIADISKSIRTQDRTFPRITVHDDYETIMRKLESVNVGNTTTNPIPAGQKPPGSPAVTPGKRFTYDPTSDTLTAQ